MTDIIEPWDVNYKRFPVKKDQVLYYGNHYALAISPWEGGDKKLGIRWCNSKYGFPKYPNDHNSYYPLWMVVPDELAVPILEFIKEKHKDGENLVDHKRIDEYITELEKNIKK